MILCLAGAVWAGDHEVAAPPSVAVAAHPVPPGPARAVEAAAGADLQALVWSLPAGSTVTLSAGTFTGPLVIDRPLTLTGRPGATLTGAGAGSVLVLAAADVTLANLRVTGGGHQPQNDDAGVVIAGDRARVSGVTVDDVYLGIDLRMADDAVVIGCTVRGDPTAPFGLRGDGIRLWESDRNLIAENTLDHVRDLVIWYADDNIVRDNVVRDSRYGTHLMHTAGNQISGNRYLDDVVGVFVMYSARITVDRNVVAGAHGEAGVGIGLKESDEITIVGNTLVDDTTGLYVDTVPQRVGGHAEFRGNVIAGNEVGVRFHGPSDGGRFTENVFVENRIAASVDASRGPLLGVTFDRNHWSDYAGYDLDGDGYGDLPFEARSAAASLFEREPAMAFLAGTPALALIELFAQAFPLFAPPVWFSDPHPSMMAVRS